MSTEKICGNCKHFMPFENRRSGRCGKREFLYKKGGSAYVMNRKFIANYSRKACVTDFEPIVLKKMTNYERIKAMTVEEMAEMLCEALEFEFEKDVILQWLEAEVQEDESTN